MSTLRKEGTDTADELVESGQRFYDEHLRQSLEPEHTGRYVAIEPDSGRYFLADTGTGSVARIAIHVSFLPLALLTLLTESIHEASLLAFQVATLHPGCHPALRSLVLPVPTFLSRR
jgi:hypothetical protein